MAWSRRRGGALRVHDISTRVSVYIARARGDRKKHARDRSRFLALASSDLVHGARARAPR